MSQLQEVYIYLGVIGIIFFALFTGIKKLINNFLK